MMAQWVEQLWDSLSGFSLVVLGLQCNVEDRVLSHPALQEELNNPKNGDSAHKHLKQQVHKNSWTHLCFRTIGPDPHLQLCGVSSPLS